MFKTLYKQIGQYKTAAVLTPVFIMLEVALDVLIPYVTASLIDDGINAAHLGNVYKYGAIMLGMALMSLLLGITAGRFSAYASSGFACNVRSAMYRNIQRFAFSDIDKYSTGGLVTRMTTDVTNLQNAFQMLLRISVRAPLNMVSSIIMCFVISGQMSLIFIVAAAFLSLVLFFIIKAVSKVFARVFMQYDVLNTSVQENVTAIRVVKAFVREDHEYDKFELAAAQLRKLYVKAESLMAINHPVMNLVVYGSIIAISWFGAQFVVGGQLTTGQLTSLFTYVMTIFMSLMMLSMIFVQITMSAASGRRVAEIIDEVPDITNPSNAEAQINDSSIDFDNVSFAYKGGSGEYALHGIDLHIKAGQTVGIIGGTGSGKSSMINLLSRLYDVSRGSVRIGGRDVRKIDLTTLRNNVAVVLQKNVLFSGTVIENLRWGNPDATLDECREACSTACAHEFIEQMPQGYDTYLEQGGANLSGGQRQRLCIARALLKKPLVIVLDDSTSACDNDTDRRIRQAFALQLPGVTKIIISQRISSIQDCERILVLNNGRMSGWDTHENLLKSNQIYKEIHALQNDAAADFDAGKARKEGAQ
ncbi:MAG: ABC transporter ATP-binding protein/permease [Muribaculaceae bacterium]|nr:ABC transporter ATP-binding protein/permease [Muribaculaceae bacterium]